MVLKVRLELTRHKGQQFLKLPWLPLHHSSINSSFYRRLPTAAPSTYRSRAYSVSIRTGGEGWIRTSEASQDTCAPNPSPTRLPVSRIPSVLAGLMKHGVTVRVFGHFTTYPILNYLLSLGQSIHQGPVQFCLSMKCLSLQALHLIHFLAPK